MRQYFLTDGAPPLTEELLDNGMPYKARALLLRDILRYTPRQWGWPFVL